MTTKKQASKQKRKMLPQQLANLKLFKKGESGNPTGGNQLINSTALRAIRALTIKELASVGESIVKMSITEIREMAARPDATGLHCMIAAIADKVISKGDAIAFDKLMDRLVGKPKESPEHGAGSGPRIVINIPSNGREVKPIVKGNVLDIPIGGEPSDKKADGS